MEPVPILGLRVNPTSYSEAVAACLAWAQTRQSKYVCVANVHMTMEGWDSADLQRVFNSADLVVPDGMPLVWALRLLGGRSATRVRGPDLMLKLCEAAAENEIPVALYGGTEESLAKAIGFLKAQYPLLDVACALAPPFRPLTEEEISQHVARISASGARIVFVGIGCPKQEIWMAGNRGRLQAVMLGVGAAFDLISGRTRHAPLWMQRVGLEWLFRLLTEPRRLWKRYLKHNPRFLSLFAIQRLAGAFGVRVFEKRRAGKGDE